MTLLAASRERVMAGWLDGIEEAAFRPAPGGHIFISPNPWFIGRPRYYLVTDAQKAVIGDCLRKRVRFAMVFSLLSFVVVLALVTAIIVYFRHAPVPPFLMTVFVTIVLVIPVLIVPHVYQMRMLGPITKELPLADQRFTIREQFSNVAGAAPKWLIYVGMAAGMCVILGGLIGMYDLWSEGRLAGRWFGPAASMTGGVILAGYFMYLVKLRKK